MLPVPVDSGSDLALSDPFLVWLDYAIQSAIASEASRGPAQRD